MFATKPTFLALGAILGIGLAALPARAEDAESFCRNYAATAINQSRAARNHDRCLHFIAADPRRWSLNYDGHFRYCMGAYGSGSNAAETQARNDSLYSCIPDHRW